MQVDPVYKDVVKEVFEFLNQKVIELKKNGINKIIIDPGFGFGKSLNDNYILLRNLEDLKKTGCPILAGISRKSMIGKIVDVPPSDRLSGTVALNTIAILNGARIIRVHDVKENFKAIKVIEKYLQTTD
jgi:dihydropteroate synthase